MSDPQPAEKPVRSTAPTAPPGFGRIPVTRVRPVLEEGAYPAKAVVGELVPFHARVFREGHDAVNATVVLTSPSGTTTRIDMAPIEPRGLDPWIAWARIDEEGLWTFHIEAWSDPWGTWLHNASVKLPAEMDVPLVCLEGRALLEEGARTAESSGEPVTASILRSTAALLIPERPGADLAEVARQTGVAKAMEVFGPRELVTPTRSYEIWADRKRALFSSWYEFFPRSQGAYRDAAGHWVSGTFDTCHDRLDEVAELGFDVVYFPPIHPIGSSFRKGRNNTLAASAEDPGSPWAIGSADGGHDAIHPDLGDWDSFDRLVAHAHDLGLEIALDLALQASPDHPWVAECPQFFTTRLDGTIAYAENPPKKYQDIYPLNFDNDPDGIFEEVLRIIRLWVSHGVTIFRVDNPHTKPVTFWQRLIAELRRTDPDVLLLAEAFTRPEMMHALGKVGFHQSYTYFTWRNTRTELEEYLTEVSSETDAFFRPNFFVNTPDINPAFLQSGTPAAFAIRAILAATMSPSWGVYSGFELFEHVPLRPGGEEYLDSEKYEYRPRHYNAEPNLNLLLSTLNRIRRRHPALQQLRRVELLPNPHSEVISFVKTDGDDRVIVICSLNPYGTVETQVDLPPDILGVPTERVRVLDELTGAAFTWSEQNFVRLTPGQPAHILHVL
nr:alpha-1,4-glucan--maltose-1-phosphate maltosyltransferase [Propionicicella superfundia]